MKTRSGGYAKAFRRRWEHPIFKDKVEAAVWAWMTDTARFAPHHFQTRFGMVRLERGQLLISERGIATDFRLHKNTVRGLLSRMLHDGMLALNRDHEASRAGTIATILKYDQYQGLEGSEEGGQDQGLTTAKTITGPRQDHERTTREEREEREEGKGMVKSNIVDLELPIDQAVQDWNAVAATCSWPKVQKLTPARRDKLKARLKEHKLDGWRAALTRASKSDWLGSTEPPNWFTFDFITRNPENIVKLLEGNYDKSFTSSSEKRSGWITGIDAGC